MDIVVKPWTGINRTAYDLVNDLSRVAEGYKRCRKTQYFIVSQEAIDKAKPDCAICDKPITSDNRGQYSPKHKRAVVMHYDCAWSSLLNDIFTKGREIYG